MTSGSLLVGIQSNLDDPDAQHSPPSYSCEEAEPLVGATLVSHAEWSSRKRRNRETQNRQANSLKLAERLAKRKFLAKPEISHPLAEQLLRDWEPRTDENFVDAIHASQRPAFLQEYSKVFFLQPWWRGQLWRLVEAGELSV